MKYFTRKKIHVFLTSLEVGVLANQCICEVGANRYADPDANSKPEP